MKSVDYQQIISRGGLMIEIAFTESTDLSSLEL